MNSIREMVMSDFSSAAVIDNFRVAADGTLTKRDGCVLLADLGQTVRGTVYDGGSVIYAVAGSELYRISDGDAYYIDELYDCSFDSDDEQCIMFMYSGIVYILGGGAVYRYDTVNDILESDAGYAPIYKSSVSDYTVERFNMITSRVREVTTMSSSDNMYIFSPIPTAVHSVTVDGTVLTSSQYKHAKIGSASYYVQITDTSVLSSASVVVLEYSANKSVFAPLTSQYTSSRRAYVYEGENAVRVFLYGNDEGCIYYSEPMVDSYGNTAVADYFPRHFKLTIGDGTEKILAVARQEDRTVVITQKASYYLVEATVTDADGATHAGFRTVEINDELGVSENSGTVSYEDSLYLINPLGLYRLSFNPVELKYSASLIDIPDNVGITRAELSSVRLYLDRTNHELWCQNGDVIAVMSLASGKWYRFSGFTPSMMFTYRSAAAFCEGSRICLFCVGETDDCGVGFDAYVETRNLDFGSIFAEKTVYGFGAAFERRDGAVLECTLKSDKGDVFTFSVASDDDAGDTSPVVKRTHARLGGLSYVICRIVSPGGAAPANVRRIMLRYRMIGGS